MSGLWKYARFSLALNGMILLFFVWLVVVLVFGLNRASARIVGRFYPRF